MAIEILAPIGAFFMITLSIALATRLIATGMLNRTIREALRSEPGSVPLLVAKLEARQPWADAMLGWIFLALAVGLVALSLFEDDYDRRELLQAAMIPTIVGLTVLLYVRLARPAPAIPMPPSIAPLPMSVGPLPPAAVIAAATAEAEAAIRVLQEEAKQTSADAASAQASLEQIARDAAQVPPPPPTPATR